MRWHGTIYSLFTGYLSESHHINDHIMTSQEMSSNVTVLKGTLLTNPAIHKYEPLSMPVNISIKIGFLLGSTSNFQGLLFSCLRPDQAKNRIFSRGGVCSLNWKTFHDIWMMIFGDISWHMMIFGDISWQNMSFIMIYHDLTRQIMKWPHLIQRGNPIYPPY